MAKFLPGALALILGACCKAPDRPASSHSTPSPEVSLRAAVAADGIVTLTWEPGETSSSTLYYKVERREVPGSWGSFDQIVVSNHPSVKFQDSKTRPKTNYEYKVTLGLMHAGKPGRLTDRVGGPVAVRTPGIWSVEFSNIQSFENDDDVPKPGQAYVIIRKYDKEHGLVEWRKIQHEGEMLGVSKEGEVENSRHRIVTKTGRMATVDFKMGGAIKKIASDKFVPYTFMKCTPMLVKNGAWECPGPGKISATYKVNEVKYTDEDGKDQTISTPSGPGPISDYLCSDHKDSPDSKPVHAKRDLQDVEGTILLQQADALWESLDAAELKKAQSTYRKLLDSHADHPDVIRRRAELAHRSRQKVD